VEIVQSVQRMREKSSKHRVEGRTVALVPTMGAFHERHLDLVRRASEVADRVVVSIFVNPMQFGPGEDLDRYPKDMEGDRGKLEALGVDTLFTPGGEEVYPEGYQTRVRVTGVEKHLCGLTRPVHFSGVATVVLKLFNMCLPDFAVFGMKDYQQIRVIERMVRDLNLDVRIVRHETVRESDGLAMSSRNRYLTPDERVRAPVLHAALREMAAAVEAGERDAASLLRRGRDRLSGAGLTVEYLNICDAFTLDDVSRVESTVVMAVAVQLGAARLIDNVVVEPGKEETP